MVNPALFPTYIGFGKLKPESFVETENEISADYYFQDKAVHRVTGYKNQNFWFMWDNFEDKEGSSSSATKLEHLAVNHFMALDCKTNPIFHYVHRSVCNLDNILFEQLPSFRDKQYVMNYHPAGRMLVLRLPIPNDKDSKRKMSIIEDHLAYLESNKKTGTRLLKSYNSSILLTKKNGDKRLLDFKMIELIVPLAYIYETSSFLSINNIIRKDKKMRMVVQDSSNIISHSMHQFTGSDQDDFKTYSIFYKGTVDKNLDFDEFKKKRIEAMSNSLTIGQKLRLKISDLFGLT